ncbi:MAG: hypothetical protein VB067_05325 [Christensenellaceae bacterium]|nr:hypothetical protein [Christensenellaceae bacterium]MEA5065882.1 hypothetical protein [Eubacteriales bacterium]MEA5068387.1 hypothetical protein [Christensenellaceae bacterium]
MTIAILIVLYLCVLLIDFGSIRKTCAPGMKVLYLSLLVISFAALMLSELGVTLPSPAKPIVQAVKAVRSLFGAS